MVGKAVIKKVSGIRVEDLQSAYEHGISICKDDVADEAQGMGKEALQAFFEEALKSHTGKQSAIKELQGSIAALLAFMRDEEAAKLPLFIFVDELDRCRPDYAIRLLEGVKHLFNVQGVCFVFTTNMTQLAASTKAIYGGEFDAATYLKRFFSFMYRLPVPELTAYARVLAMESYALSAGHTFYSGLPGKDVAADPVETLTLSLGAIASAFKLTLRDVKQVFRISEAAIPSLDVRYPVHALYLLALSAISQRRPDLLDSLDGAQCDFDAVLKQLQLRSVEFTYTVPGAVLAGEKTAKVLLAEILSVYGAAARNETQYFSGLRQSLGGRQDHLSDVLRRVADEYHSSVDSLNAPSAIAGYARTVRLAGQVMDPPIARSVGAA